MKYEVIPTSRFKKDVRRIKKRGYDLNLLQDVIDILAKGEKLPRKYLDHPLSGKWEGTRECHITPDWLLIYEITENDLLLYLTRTGTHSDLLK